MSQCMLCGQAVSARHEAAMPEGSSAVPLQFRISRDLHARIKELTRERGEKMSDFVERAIENLVTTLSQARNVPKCEAPPAPGERVKRAPKKAAEPIIREPYWSYHAKQRLLEFVYGLDADEECRKLEAENPNLRAAVRAGLGGSACIRLKNGWRLPILEDGTIPTVLPKREAQAAMIRGTRVVKRPEPPELEEQLAEYFEDWAKGAMT